MMVLLCFLSYVKINDVVDTILYLGRGSQLAKMDVKSAFRIIPVHPADRHLLGICWNESLYVDATLPFGLRSAPNAVADALKWILREQGIVYIWHYLDDFFVARMLGSNECMNALSTMLRICKILGIPLADEKVAGSTTTITILGIEFDWRSCPVLRPSLPTGPVRRSAQRELQSLIGQLQDASTVIKPGRTFLRRMYDLLGLVKQPHHHIHLNTDFRSDLA